MRTFNSLIFLGLISFLLSCDKKDDNSKSVFVTVFNKASKNIDLLFLTTIDKTSKSKNYSVDTCNHVNFDFKFENETNSDGTYELCYKYKDSDDTIKYNLGYYTNGILLESDLLINIYCDSVNVNRTSKDFNPY